MTYVVENTDDRIVIRDISEDENAAQSLILDIVMKGDDYFEEFQQFEVVGQFLSNDDFYQGLNMTTVIRRKSDGKLFGYSWWDDNSKHSESYIEANGDAHGFGYDEEPWYATYVWLPVKEISIKGYEVVT